MTSAYDEVGRLATSTYEDSIRAAHEQGRLKGRAERDEEILGTLSEVVVSLIDWIRDSSLPVRTQLELTTPLRELGFCPKTVERLSDHGYETLEKYLAAERWQLLAISGIGHHYLDAFNRKLLVLGLYPKSLRLRLPTTHVEGGEI